MILPQLQGSRHGLILLPPSPVSNKIEVEIRLGLVNETAEIQSWRVTLYVDSIENCCLLNGSIIEVSPNDPVLFKQKISTAGLEGQHRVYAELVLCSTGETFRYDRPLEVLDCVNRSTDRIDGAFAGFFHWSPVEGRLWNDELRTWKQQDWADMMRAMHEVSMDILLPQEAIRNQEYVGQHTMEKTGYHGKAFYPSKLFPGRMDIACDDPLEACLAAADELDMSVFLPIGMYAWFDFSSGSLEWHKQVVQEMWERYGHHKSVYGFYVSEEVCGDLGATKKDKTDIIEFFREFTPFYRRLAPECPIMLASNCHYLDKAKNYYPELLKNLDILCTFAFHRMPPFDRTGEEAAALLQSMCDAAGSHLWLDMEAFLFEDDNALYPRPVEGLIEDFRRFPNFEKVVCYQFPGIFNPPWARSKPGGERTVQLFNDYKQYLEKHRTWTGK